LYEEFFMATLKFDNGKSQDKGNLTTTTSSVCVEDVASGGTHVDDKSHYIVPLEMKENEEDLTQRRKV
jgi:hypothetical protein